MKEIDLNEVRQLQINLLDYAISICKRENIRVSLDAGTLIGAVRHKGYIPWDDDIDITMPREDYNKLINILSCSEHSRYKLFCSKTNDEYYYPFAKLVDVGTILFEESVHQISGLGVNIDIFPQDDLPNDEKKCRKFQKRVHSMRCRVMYAVNKPVSILSLLEHPRDNFKRILYTWLGWKKELPKLENYVQKYNSPNAEYCEQLVSTSNIYRKGKKSFFDEYTELEFEGKMYPVIKEYDKYLRNAYGDYMQLPPPEKRVTHHDFKAYIKED